jgi:hypothetical protein
MPTPWHSFAQRKSHAAAILWCRSAMTIARARFKSVQELTNSTAKMRLKLKLLRPPTLKLARTNKIYNNKSCRATWVLQLCLYGFGLVRPRF